MKKYLVIGNPIEHSLSPKLHNFWIKDNKINAIYEKKKLDKTDLEDIILMVKEQKLQGINVTVPFKKTIIPYLDQLTPEAQKTESVNTIYLKDNKILGHNTDIDGFELGIKNFKFDVRGKRIFILGAGGVVSSLILALNRMNAAQIIISNRTKEKAENLKNLFKNIVVTEWGQLPDFDMIINATSIGLNEIDRINLDFSKVGKNKFFYDVIYNPKVTNFIKTGQNLGHMAENGKLMFIYQASEAFKIWHGVDPKINNEVLELID